MAFGSSVLTHKKEQQIKIEGEFKPTVDCLCAIRRGLMEWDEDLRYRFRGQFLEQGDNKMMLFAFDEPEMIKVEEIVLPPKENTEEDEGETVKKKIYIFPPEWAGTFGQPITSIAQVHSFQCCDLRHTIRKIPGKPRNAGTDNQIHLLVFGISHHALKRIPFSQ